MSKSKYNAKKVELDGYVFDSQHERDVYLQLKEMQQRGEIEGLEVHPTFLIVPKQTEEYTTPKGKVKERVVERPAYYEGDFYYTDKEGDAHLVDAKSEMTRKLPLYKLKRKMVRYLWHLAIEEM